MTSPGRFDEPMDQSQDRGALFPGVLVNPVSIAPFFSRKFAEATGTTTTATSIDAMMEAEMAMPMSEKSCPASSSMKRTGRKTRTVVIVPERTAAQTLRTPSRAASNRLFPRLPFLRDALEDDDGVVDRHADGEGDPGQRNHVDGAAEEEEADESRDDADRHPEHSHQRGRRGPEKEEHHERGQGGADEDILNHVGDGVFDIADVLTAQRHLEAGRSEDVLVELLDERQHLVLDLDHVRTGLADDADPDATVRPRLSAFLAPGHEGPSKPGHPNSEQFAPELTNLPNVAVFPAGVSS